MILEANYSQEKGLTIAIVADFDEVSERVLSIFRRELDQKPDVKRRIIDRGITEDREIIHTYIICQYGGHDSRNDIENGRSVSDYCHCGHRGSCKDEGYPGLCSMPRINDVILSPAEVENLRMAADGLSIKMAADRRYRSPMTLQTQYKVTRSKLNVHSVTAAVSLAAKEGVI